MEGSIYNFDKANTDMLFKLFDMYEAEADALLDVDDPLVLPGYDYCLKCSHVFNVLDARGAISVAERTAYIHRCAISLVRLLRHTWPKGKRWAFRS